MTAVQHTKQTPNSNIHHSINQPEKMEELNQVVDRCTTNDNHSNDNLDEIHETTDLDRYSISEYRRETCPHTMGRCELHKKSPVYGKGLIVKKLVGDVYGGGRRAGDLKCKWRWDARERLGTVGRTMEACARALGVLVVLAVLATSDAAPARSRAPRSPHHLISARSYLETFGYLKKGQPANLLLGDKGKDYEDDYRIAIKTLQEFGGIPVTGVVDEETKRLMKQKRCGRPDVEDSGLEGGRRKKRFAIQGEIWKHTNLTWSMSSNRVPSQLKFHETRGVLARALDVWQQASRLTFTEINSDKADIVVSFAKGYHDDAYPFDGRGTILAHAFFPGSGRGGDAHFDDDELWLLHPKNDEEAGTSLFAVAAHEFGHSLGLAHSSVRGALMFPWYQGIQPNFVLPEDDRNGIQQMYGPKEKRTWAKIPRYRPAETPPTTTTTTTTTTTQSSRTYYYHHNRHHITPRPDYPRNPSRNPAYYPDRTYFPDRRHYNTSEEHPRRPTHNHHPRPTPETTTQLNTYRPRYPTARPEYPSYPRPNPPNYPNRDTPKIKPHHPVRTTPRPSVKPDTCDTTYDAVALIRGELFIFKNQYHWRIGAQGRYAHYPVEITRMWTDLPRDLTHVDAVYERPDRKIAFFVGRQLYLFDTQYLMPGYPKPLTDLGLPASLDKLDAAMVWGHNGKTYFFSGSMYWKFDEDEGRVELDYPRDMSMWKGVGYNIDSVFQWKDGKTYFFKGKGFWKFNDLQMRVEHEKQLSSATFWMGCPNERVGRRSPFRAPPAPGSTLRSPAAAHAHLIVPNCLLAALSSALLLLATYFRYCF